MGQDSRKKTFQQAVFWPQLATTPLKLRKSLKDPASTCPLRRDVEVAANTQTYRKANLLLGKGYTIRHKLGVPDL